MNQKQTSTIGIIADDLTSAADGSAPFAQRNLTAVVGLNGFVPQRGAVKSVDIVSRGLPPRHAFAKAFNAAKALSEVGILYKTVDSTLRGNIAYEMRATLDASKRNSIIFAPAFPAAGRTTRHGRQFVGDHLLSDSEYVHDPVHPVRSDKLYDVLGDLGKHAVIIPREKIGTLHTPVDSVLIVDAEFQADLDLLVKRIRQPTQCLWVGSPGLAQALALRFGGDKTILSENLSQNKYISRKVLIAVGSANPTSRKQLQHLNEICTPILSIFDNSVDESNIVCVATPGKRYENPQQLLFQFSKNVSALLQDNNFDGLIATGGDTANQILKFLGVTNFELLGEISPGFPLGRAEKPYALNIALKAGGFGNHDTLIRAAKILMNETDAEKK